MSQAIAQSGRCPAMPEFKAPPYVANMQRVDSYKEIDEILRSMDFHQGSHLESGPFFADSLLMRDGPGHMERRRLVATLFSRAALQTYETEALMPVIAQVMDELRQKAGPDGAVDADLVDLVRTMLHRITAVVTGVDGVDTRERTERFRHLIEKLGEAVTVEWSMRDHEEVIAEGKQIRKELVDEFLLPSLDRRRALVARHKAGEIERKDLPTDLLTLLCLNGDDAQDGDEGYVWRECALFLVAATQTTTHTLPHVVLHLDEWFADHPEDRSKTSDAEWLRRAAQEALRMHQPAPTLLRIASKDMTLSTGRRIGKDERIALFFSPANRDTGVFGEDSNAFDPNRELAKNQQPWGLTFGGGAHLCIGRPLVTGLSNKTDPSGGTEGTMVRILRTLYDAGIELDRTQSPKRTESSYHDSYASVPVILRKP